MILINLLPAEVGARERKPIVIPYRPILITVFGFLVLLFLYNVFYSIQIHSQKGRLEQQWEVLKAPALEAEQLEVDMGASVSSEIDFYDSLVDPPLEVAHVMNLASEFIPKTLWLTSFGFERKLKEVEVSLIGFSESSRRESELVEIQNFINTLKDEMERLANPQVQTTGVPKRSITPTMTTTNKQEEGGKRVLVEFRAVLQTEGFNKVPEQPFS